ncbi:MAG: ABC transporter permease [Anaerolineales bacterium]|nr:ABC transporter permease [Anaerolineales bacterium]
MQINEKVYDSANLRHPLIEELLAVIKYRNLILQFISRSLKTRYKRSVLGVVWTLLNPILTMIILTLVFSNIFRFDIEYYAIYILSGLVVWNFFSSTTQGSMSDMIWSGDLLHRIYVPKSVFAISAVGTALVNMSISLIPLFGISLILGMRLNFSIVVMPVAMLFLIIFALGVGLLLSTAAAYFSDVLPVYDVILTMWMYATPIIYPFEILPDWVQPVFKLNPLLHLLTLFRAPLFEGVIPDWQTWVIGASVSLVVFICGGLIFTAKSNEYAYRV